MERYFPCFITDWMAIAKAVNPEQGWNLFLRCLYRASGDQLPEEADPVVAAFFELVSGGIDRSITKSEKVAQKRRYARYCGVCKEAGTLPLQFDQWKTDVDICQQVSTSSTCVNNHNQESKSIIKNQESKSRIEIKNQESNNNREDGKPSRSTKFVPPTVEEVKVYCQERGNTVDSEMFVNFYAAKGWKVGNTNMKDWRAAVRTWEKRERDAGSVKSKNIHDPDRYSYKGGESL